MTATAPDRCPCCGGPLAGSALSWRPKDRALTGEGRAVALSKLEATIFDVLWSMRPTGSSIDIYALAERVYVDRSDGGPDDIGKSLRTIITRLRFKLRHFGLTIAAGRGRGNEGYRLIEARP